jgi:hypothetical protein
MTDHPLVPKIVREYMDKFQIEDNLNKALNHVLLDLP